MRIKLDQLFRFKIVPANRLRGDEPQLSFAIDTNIIDIAQRINKWNEPLILRIKTEKAFLWTDPEQTFRINRKGGDQIARQAAVILVSNIEDFEAVTVETIQAVFGAKPHEAVLILYAAKNRIIRQPIFNFIMPEVVGLRVCKANHDQ